MMLPSIKPGPFGCLCASQRFLLQAGPYYGSLSCHADPTWMCHFALKVSNSKGVMEWWTGKL
jgi:hypothetical protein